MFNMVRCAVLCLLFSLCGLLTACTTLNAPGTPSGDDGLPLGTHYLDRHVRQAQLAALQAWTAQGNIAANNDQKGWNASYHWQQKDNHYKLILFGPLGLGRTQLDGAPEQVTLTTAAGRRYNATNPEILLQQQTGWNLPVSNLLYWLRGLPAPHSRFKESFDMNNHLVNLRQDGWQLIYLRYVSVNGVDLPSRIYLSNADWQVHLLVSKWQLR